MRFATEQEKLLADWSKAIDDAADESAIRQVLKAALNTQAMSHRVFRELSKAARDRIAKFSKGAAATTDASPANGRVEASGKKGAKA